MATPSPPFRVRREVPTIVRSLGINPSQNQLREIMNMVRDPDIDSGFIQYDRFEKELLRLVTEQQNELIRDSEDKLLRAFRAFDPEGRGYIEPEKLKRFALNNGDKMTEEEVTEMLDFYVDKGSGHVYYEDFAEHLATEGRII